MKQKRKTYHKHFDSDSNSIQSDLDAIDIDQYYTNRRAKIQLIQQKRIQIREYSSSGFETDITSEDDLIENSDDYYSSSSDINSEDDINMYIQKKRTKASKRRQKQRQKKKRKNQQHTHNQFRLKNNIDDFCSDGLSQHYIGKMNIKCKHCDALLWIEEKLSNSSKSNPKFSMCCSQGAIKIPLLPEPPKELKKLFDDIHSKIGKYFHEHIRSLNMAFAMASMKADKIIQFPKNTLQTFVINGMVHHRIGGLTPYGNKKHAFAQIYIMDNTEQIDFRSQLNGLSKDNPHEAKIICSKLQKILEKENIFVDRIKTAYELAKTQPLPEVKLVLRDDIKPNNAHQRTYNAPTCSEIAIITPSSNAQEKQILHRDLVIQWKSGHLQNIYETSPYYDALQYVLLQPWGTYGFSNGIRRHRKSKTRCMLFYICIVLNIHIYSLYIYSKRNNERFL